MNLARALRIDGPVRLALVGAGGKTSALFALGEQAAGPVVLAASTHLGIDQARRAERHWAVTRPEEVKAALENAGEVKTTLLTGPDQADGRTGALDADLLEQVHLICSQMGYPVFLEADGARTRALKAPAAHEPAIPGWVDMVVVCAGLSGLGQPLEDGVVHRPQIFSTLSGLEIGQLVTPETVIRVLLHPQGGLKGIPPGARRAALLNQADTPALAETGREMASRLLTGYDAVVVAALKDEQVWAACEPAAGIILAAGGARRFGQPKVLLDWHGQPLVRHAAEKALRAGLNPVRVVAGAEEAQIRAALDGLAVDIVSNPDWQQGQSTSVAAGVRGLPPRSGSALFLLADQPLVPLAVIRKLVRAHEESLAPVVAPRVQGRRANPVLFDRATFADLLSVTGDQGGRALFERYSPGWLDLDDARLLFDVDTPEDYARLLDVPLEDA